MVAADAELGQGVDHVTDRVELWWESDGETAESLPGRVRDAMPQKVQLIPLQARYPMRQTIALSFLRTRERDPNLLALLAVCRTARAGSGDAASGVNPRSFRGA